MCNSIQCEAGFEQILNNCVEICGDGLIINHECDDKN